MRICCIRHLENFSYILSRGEGAQITALVRKDNGGKNLFREFYDRKGLVKLGRKADKAVCFETSRNYLKGTAPNLPAPLIPESRRPDSYSAPLVPKRP